MATKQSSPLVTALFGSLFLIGGGIFIVVGATQVLHQADCLQHYVPVSAHVVAVAIKSHAGKHGSSYSPCVSYTYEVNEHRYSGSQVQIIEHSSSRAWAEAVVERFPVGATVTAYRSPAAPGSAFLVHEANSMPYLFMMFPLLHVVIGLAVVLFGSYPASSSDPAGKARRMLAIALVVWLVTGSAGIHYALFGRPVRVGMVIAFVVAAAVDVGLLVLWRRMLPQPGAADLPDAGNPYRHAEAHRS
jgi:hypothetical protein